MEQLEQTTDLDLAAIEQLAVDCAQACVDVVELRRELHDAKVALDEQRRMSAMFLKQASYLGVENDRLRADLAATEADDGE